jgi:predicted nuclease of restriction endonuclease-like (RecB) superfamily
MTDSPVHNGEEYTLFLDELKTRIRAAQVRAALDVNRELLLLYWHIGRDLLQRRQTRGWGAKIIDRLAADLHYMRAFAAAYPDEQFVQQLAAQLPWGHHVRLLDAVNNPPTREWYMRHAIQHGWSRDILVHQISSGLLTCSGARRTVRASVSFSAGARIG